MIQPEPPATLPQGATRYYQFKQGPTRFALRFCDLVGIEHLSFVRPLPLTDQSLLGFGLYRDQILPVFDPLSLAGLSLVKVTSPLTVAVAGTAGCPALAFACTETGNTVDLLERNLPPAGSRITEAFLGEQSFEDGSLLLLNPAGLARTFGLVFGDPFP